MAKEVHPVMPQEIAANIYLISVPLPRNPLRVLNSYLIRGEKRHLMIDTGFNWPECKAVQFEALARLGIDRGDLDFFITHAHGDHVGLLGELAAEGSVVYYSRTDAHIVKRFMQPDYWKASDEFYRMHGFPVIRINRNTDDIDDYIARAAKITPVFVEDGDRLEAGPYQFTCVSTPGHSPGHMCLYEPEQQLFFSGDHILDGITSNITPWGGELDCLGLYLESLKKVESMEIKVVLPGHRSLIYDHRRRISELMEHHRRRLAELLEILRAGEMTAYQAASRMHWDLKYDSWEDFPDFQKWFATGEAVAHLEHLAVLGQVQRVHSNDGELMKYKIK